MLLKPVHINTAMNLSANGVTMALHCNGYADDCVKTASFMGMTPNGSFVYTCTYFDDETQQNEEAIVYVHFNDKRVLVADY